MQEKQQKEAAAASGRLKQSPGELRLQKGILTVCQGAAIGALHACSQICSRRWLFTTSLYHCWSRCLAKLAEEGVRQARTATALVRAFYL